MATRKLGLIVCCFSLLAPAYGELTKFDNSASFPLNKVTLGFDTYVDGALAADLYAQWGVTFDAPEGSSPVIRVVPPTIGGIPEDRWDRVLRNEAGSGSSADLSLVVNFKYPLDRVGFWLGNGDAATNVTFQGFDPLGVLLGTQTQVGLPSTAGGEVFVGLTTSSPRGIAKLIIDYGAATNAEQLDNLTIHYLSRPQFTTFIGQIADFGGPPRLQSILVVANLSNSTAQGEVRFYTSESAAMSLNMTEASGAAVAGSVVAFEIDPYTSKSFTTNGVGAQVKWGYVEIVSTVPVQATTVFRVFNQDGSLASEAGIGSSVGRYLSEGVIRKVDTVVLGTMLFDSGVAVVNTAAKAANTRAFLFNEAGTRVATNDTMFDLPARNHIAKFAREIFKAYFDAHPLEDFRGSIVITSDVPLAMVIIRTLNGIALSTLPVGSTEP